MSIGTILLIGGAVAIMLLMHRVGHADHASAQRPTVTAAVRRPPVMAAVLSAPEAPAAGPKPMATSVAGTMWMTARWTKRGAGQRQKKHGCC